MRQLIGHSSYQHISTLATMRGASATIREDKIKQNQRNPHNASSGSGRGGDSKNKNDVMRRWYWCISSQYFEF